MNDHSFPCLVIASVEQVEIAHGGGPARCDGGSYRERPRELPGQDDNDRAGAR